MEHMMQYQYSSVVDESTYETHGLCDGIPLRCHHNPELEEAETLRCQEDWRRWVGPLGFYKGGLGPRWNFMAITVPECLPERLGVLGYANELAFLHDGSDSWQLQGDAHNDDLKVAFEQGALTGNIEKAASGKRAIQAHIAREMLKIHKEQASVTMKAWAKFAELGSGRHHDTHFKTEAEYIKYRMIDIGTMFWYGMVTFGMAISIPEDEVDLAHELANVAYLNLGLTNDLYSYQKEYETAMAMGQDYVVNIIWVLMEEHNISEDEAKEMCRDKIKQTIVDFRQIVKETNARTDVSVDTKRYIEGLLYSLSGNLVWSIDCPRYHTWSSYNERQLDWMKHGIPDKDGKPSGYGYANTRNANSQETGQPNGESNGVAPHSASESAPPATNGSGPSSNGMVDTGLVNIIQAPYDYLSSLPSKGTREKAIDALNVWFQVPADKLERIKQVTKILHSASLMLDDLEDGSHLRRGKPSTHTIFGAGQTVNAANYQILRALEEVQKLGSPKSIGIYAEELKSLYLGQSLDLHWTSNLICPSIEQYLQMVENKTGGLFRLLGRLMAEHSTKSVDVDVVEFLNDLGRYFQTRDDYQNLVSPVYTEQKGFCEDLDEGKYSLPLIHLLLTSRSETLLRNILTQRRVNGGSNVAHKQTLLALMEKSSSLAFTVQFLATLHAKVENNLEELEEQFGVQNYELRGILRMLAV
ncbi:putative geranylgeranyl diphosphate synthase [Chaetomium sp. MPI-CAGE-AT-0009]|nr:putative geranylgeranyl diphosphate synthase [Chaetomium sp. MPI-CAGE-AT-0009]